MTDHVFRGDGSDGALVVYTGEKYECTREMNFTSLTMYSGSEFEANGWQVNVRDSATYAAYEQRRHE